jgi:hypothetical protein
MKAILAEPFLVVASSLLWIIVLPIAALICSGLAISERVEAYKARYLSVPWPGNSGLHGAARPSHLA